MNTATTKNEVTTTMSTAAAPTTLNGVDLAKFAATAGALVADPSLAAIGFRAKTTWHGGVRSSTQIEDYQLAGKTIPRRHQIETDEPVEMFGKDEGPNPQDLLLAALNSCMMVGFVAGATAEGIRIEALEIESSCNFDLRGAFGLDPSVAPGAKTIEYTVRLRCNASREKIEEIHKNVRLTSPNFHHLATPVLLEGRVVTI